MNTSGYKLNSRALQILAFLFISSQVLGQVSIDKRISSSPFTASQNGTMKDKINTAEDKKKLPIIQSTTSGDIKIDRPISIEEMLKKSKALQTGGSNGGGGDDVGLQFQSALEAALTNYKKDDPQTFAKFQKALLDVQKSVRFIVVDFDLELIPFYEVLQNSIAINIPEMKLIVINRGRWKMMDDSRLREGLALHEVLSLIHLEDTGVYNYSARYVSLQKASVEVFKSFLYMDRINQLHGANTQVSHDEIENRDNAFRVMSNADKLCKGVTVQPVCFGESACRHLYFANASLNDSVDRKTIKVEPVKNLWSSFEIGQGNTLPKDVMSNVSYRPHLRECAKALRSMYDWLMPVAVRKFPIGVYMNYFQPVQMGLFNINQDAASQESFKNLPQNTIVVYWRNPGSLANDKK